MPVDWSSYNIALVDDVSYFLTRNFLESLKKFGVKRKGKVGRPPYSNTNSLMILLALIRAYFRRIGRLRA